MSELQIVLLGAAVCAGLLLCDLILHRKVKVLLDECRELNAQIDAKIALLPESSTD